jgi:hypothetical protein
MMGNQIDAESWQVPEFLDTEFNGGTISWYRRSTQE